MARASGGSFEEAFNRKALTHGRVLVNQLAILVKVSQMHDLKNEAVEKAAQALVGTLGIFFEEVKSFSLALIGDYLYLEDYRVKYNVEDFNNFEMLATEFKKRKLGTLNFSSGITWQELITFSSVFLSVTPDIDEPYQALSGRMLAANISGLSIEEIRAYAQTGGGSEKTKDADANATAAYIRLLVRTRELFADLKKGSPADIRKLKRAVQSVVDSIYKGEERLLRLAALRRRTDILPRHYTNVCVLSLGVGKRLGLSKYQMARLGMAALLHDIGRLAMPDDIFKDDMEPDDSAWETIRRHPRLGVETLLRLKGLNEVAVSAMIVAYEHHRNLDGTGYPDQLEPKDINVFSRIVRIADNYDASTSAGVYGMLALRPDKAIDLMLRRVDSYYDRGFLSEFIKMMGAYPVGTYLMLTDNRTAVVYEGGGLGEGYSRPRVKIIPRGNEPGGIVDLKEKDASGGYIYEVAGVLDAQICRVNVYRFLV